ncbi:cation:proton antiporter [Anoxybacter fermentans]|uniref:cation:proton antiporter n=1 Tax=Anoxybacter fermentans TaxID=1323375 RepID=UPI0013DFA5F7|nr:cation:proton antiporter [Anoxybacter fermentans]
METNLVLALGILLLAGLAGGIFISRFKLPAVTGYILAGLAVGPAILKLISWEMVEYLKPVNSIALGIIALVIGGELEIKTLRKLGKSIMWIGVMEILGAATIVFLAMLLVRQSLPNALLLGGLATATAPAATVAVIKEVRSRGPLTDSLLAIVALDDALGVIVFGIMAAVVKVLVSGVESTSISHMVTTPVLEIAYSILLGAMMGFILGVIARRVSKQKTLLTITLGIVFLTAGLASHFHLSAILANMVVGAVIVNTSPRRRKIFNLIEGIEIPIFVTFFALAGASLEIEMLGKVGVVGIIYVVARITGKVAGTYIGGHIGKAEPVVKKYLGWGLMPQAGVVVGLTMVAQDIYPEAGSLILNIILTSVVISELIGPIFSRKVLELAGEVYNEKRKNFPDNSSMT